MQTIKYEVYPKGMKHEAKDLVKRYHDHFIACTICDDGLVNVLLKVKSGSRDDFDLICDKYYPDRNYYLFYCNPEYSELLQFPANEIDISKQSPMTGLDFAMKLCETGRISPMDISAVYPESEGSTRMFCAYSFSGNFKYKDADIVFCSCSLDNLIKDHEALIEKAKQEAEQQEEENRPDGPNPNIVALSKFLSKCSFTNFCKRIKRDIIGQNDELIRACSYVYRYLTATAEGEPFNGNFMITAPSGCGKTQFFNSVKNIINKEFHCPFPVIQIDMTDITQNGFKGNDSSIILEMLYSAGSVKGEGIIFLDELDKKLLPSYSSGGDNVNASIQGELLTMIEGNIRRVEIGRGPISAGTIFDTHNTLFIGLGAFQTIRNKKLEKANQKSIGFTAEENTSKATDIYFDISYSDIIDIGARQELMGRFMQVLNFHRLSESQFLKVLEKYVKEFPSLPPNTKVEITPGGAKEFLVFANSDMGIREMYRRVNETALNEIIKIMLKNPKEKSNYTIRILGYMKTELLTEATSPEEEIPPELSYAFPDKPEEAYYEENRLTEAEANYYLTLE